MHGRLPPMRLIRLGPLIPVLPATGCYFTIPVPENRDNKFAALVSEDNGRGLIRVGLSTKSEVEALLGKRWNCYHTDQSLWVYGDYKTSGIGVWTWPLVHGGPIQREARGYYLFLKFGPDGLLRAYKL
jgi:hypothetical protein